MWGGSSVSVGQRCEALPAEISWRGQWPVLTCHHPAEGMKSSSAVPAVFLTSGNAFAAVTWADVCWAGVSPWGWCPRTKLVPLHAGALVLLCPCQCGSWQFQAHSGAPVGFSIFFISFCFVFFQWVDYPEFQHQKNRKTGVAPALALEGLFCGEWVAVVWCSIPLHKLPRCSQNTMLVWGPLCCFTIHLQRKGFARSWEAWHSSLLVQHLKPKQCLLCWELLSKSAKVNA